MGIDAVEPMDVSDHGAGAGAVHRRRALESPGPCGADRAGPGLQLRE